MVLIGWAGGTRAAGTSTGRRESRLVYATYLARSGANADDVDRGSRFYAIYVGIYLDERSGLGE